MDTRYRYSTSGRRSPTLYNPARASLPLNLLHPEHNHHHHHHSLHAVPTARREVIPISVSQARGSSERVNVALPITTTTYKIKAEPSRGSSVREGSRARRAATLDSQSIPTVITSIAAPPPRQRTVVHSNGRASPVGNPYRSSGEEQYYAVPESSGKHRHHHAKRYSAPIDNLDLNRPRDTRTYAVRGREAPVFNASSRPRSTYTTAAVVRHPDTVADDYGEDGYGYTNPKDLVQYDLSHNERRHQRRESFDAPRARPASIQGYDQAVRSYDNRERGPPPSTRGFAQVNARTWPIEPQAPPIRMPISQPLPVEPVQRPASARPVEPVQRPARVEPFGEGLAPNGVRRRTSERRPVSVYQDRERRPQGDESREYYDPRDEDLRKDKGHRRQPSRDTIADRGYNVRPERNDYDDRTDAYRPDRVERSDRNERMDRADRPERSEHKSGRDALAAGLSTAAAALGISAIAKKSSRDEARDDRDDRDEQRARREEREEREEQRRREEWEEREELRRRRDREEREAQDRDVRPPPRDERSDRNVKTPREETFPDAAPRQPQRHNSRDERDSRDESRLRPEAHSRGDSPASDEGKSRKPRSRRPSNAAGAFNPRDALDLKALKEELAAATPPPIPPKEPLDSVPQSSQPREVEKTEIRDDRGRLGALAPAANDRQLRVVSPPRDREAEKSERPVKGILRQPREKFPEDPAPIREGVAPLKDSKKDGIPPDARWTKISRKLVNPDALEAGKERYEARDDFVIVLRVLSRDEVQAYAVATQQIRAAREEAEEREASEARRRARRERHERHKLEREANQRGESTHRSRRRRHHDSHSDSQSDETTDDDQRSKVKMLEPAPRGGGGIPGQVSGATMSGGLGVDAVSTSSRRRDD